MSTSQRQFCALIVGGMQPKKIGRVIGLSVSVLIDKANPNNPINRRISLVVMNKEAEAAAGLLSGNSGVRPEDVPRRLQQVNP